MQKEFLFGTGNIQRKTRDFDFSMSLCCKIACWVPELIQEGNTGKTGHFTFYVIILEKYI